MVAARLAVAAAAQRAPPADHTDPNGPLLIKSAPSTGLD